MPTPPVTRTVAPVQLVGDLIDELARRGYDVIGPTVADGAIRLGPVERLDDLPIGVGDVQAPGIDRLRRRDDDALFGYACGPDTARRFLQPPHESVVEVTVEDGRLVARPTPTSVRRLALIGLRPCDLAGIEILDRVLAAGPHPDPRYQARRDAMFVVAVRCTESSGTCGCVRTGTGPWADDGFDIAITELVDDRLHELHVEVGSDRGAEVLDAVRSASWREATGEDDHRARGAVTAAGARQRPGPSPDELRGALADLDHDRWDRVAERCLGCGSCTLVCPTCFCTTVEERTPLGSAVVGRDRRWETCFSSDHSWIHGVGPIRDDVRTRYRQWLTHKLSTWWDQFGTAGCVGCGRCVTWCPAGIDLVEVASW